MKILIIGGNRFFGKKLAARLAGDGHRVTLLNRGQEHDGLGAKVSRINCDRTDAARLGVAVSGQSWDVVFDQVCYEPKDAESAVRIFGDKAEHYVFTSSQSIYSLGKNLLEEDFKAAEYSFGEAASSLENYPEAKRQCEAVFTKGLGSRLTSVRFPIVMGVDDYTDRLRYHIDRIRNRQPMYFPKTEARMTFVCSDDAAGALAFLATKGPVGALNVASGPVSLSVILDEIEKVLALDAVLVDEDKDCRSPYGVASDWWMNTDKLRSLGFAPADVLTWLPDVIRGSIRD